MMEELRIGQVTAASDVVQEISETEDFQTFCMACIRRHRSGDWGDIPKDDWIRNNLNARNGGRVISEYRIPEFFCIGYTDRIVVSTNEDRSETRIEFAEN